jgi:hypothetical protein
MMRRHHHDDHRRPARNRVLAAAERVIGSGGDIQAAISANASEAVR